MKNSRRLQFRILILALFCACSLPVLAANHGEQIDAMLSAGKIDAAADLLASADFTADSSMRNARLRVALIRQDYQIAEPLANDLLALPHPDAEQRELIYSWLFARDDRAEVDRRTLSVLDTAATHVDAVDLQAA